MKKQVITMVLLAASIFPASPLFLLGQDSTLDSAITLSSPTLKAAFLAYQAALQKIPQSGALQDPELDVGFFLKPMEIIDGKQVAEIKLMQMFPWFGTRKAARTEAQHMAQMAFEQFREERDMLLLKVYTQWFILCRLRQQLVNNTENMQLLQQLEELALKQYVAPLEQGSTVSPMFTLLQLRQELAAADANIENLQSELTAEKAMFNALLNRPPDTNIEIPDTLEQIPFSMDIPKSIALITEQNPMLNMLDAEDAAYRAKAVMDRKMSYPMLGVGLQYMLVNQTMGDGMAGMNGKDMMMPMVSVTIPVYRRKYKARQRETALLQQANREKYTAVRNMLEAELYQVKHRLDAAARQIDLYRKQTELTHTAYNLALQALTSGAGDLSSVVQIQRQLLDYKMKTAEAIADYNTMVANINKLISINSPFIKN
ncbi:MAG: TolC family protein [Dysgonamonadaceae bacterium]|jgi:outer membrane protein TolC|nr:TolC family protein [Dysgonamonadaceae bacterium]